MAFSYRIFAVALCLCLFATAFQGTSGAVEREGVLLVAFGTSVNEARKAYAAIESAYTREFPGAPIVWAYTSTKIRKKLAAAGIKANSVSEGLDQLASMGARSVIIQSLHIFPGEEFEELMTDAILHLRSKPGQFASARLGRPLLESAQDARDLKTVIMADSRSASADCLALMGHGNRKGIGELGLAGSKAIFRENGAPIFMESIEGERDLPGVIADLKAHSCQKVRIAPLMLVAGEHARNDLAGDSPDSWKSRLNKAGFAVIPDLRGLGELKGAPEIFLRHSRAASPLPN